MHPHFALFDSVAWWINLSAAQQLFYGIGLLAGVVTLIMAVLALFSLDHHDVSDAADITDGGSVLSTKPLTGFFLGFGWAGGIALDHGAGLLMATLIGFGAGAAVMFAVAGMIRVIYSFRSDGTQKIDDSIGQVGTVYVTLPPNRVGGGQIAVIVSGRQETLEALNASSRVLSSGEKVKVVGVVDARTVLVEPFAP